MINYFWRTFENYANFSGRASRSEFWYFVLPNTIGSFIYLLGLFILGDLTLSTTLTLVGFVLFLIYSLVAFIPTLALSVRRLHDTGNSGFWMLILALPYIGAFGILIFMLLDSDPMPNQYGQSPKKEDVKLFDLSNDKEIESIGDSLI